MARVARCGAAVRGAGGRLSRGGAARVAACVRRARARGAPAYAYTCLITVLYCTTTQRSCLNEKIESHSHTLYSMRHFGALTVCAGAAVRHADGGDRRRGLAAAHDLPALLGAQQTGAVVLAAGGGARPPPASAPPAVRHRHLPSPARRLLGARR